MRIVRILIAITAALGVTAAFTAAPQPQQSTDGRIVIAVGTLLDGRGGIQRNTRIVIEGAKIVAIDPKASPVTYALHTATLMPGWIDTHVHIGWHFGSDGKS